MQSALKQSTCVRSIPPFIFPSVPQLPQIRRSPEHASASRTRQRAERLRITKNARQREQRWRQAVAADGGCVHQALAFNSPSSCMRMKVVPGDTKRNLSACRENCSCCR